jgi:ribosome-binding factor A
MVKMEKLNDLMLAELAQAVNREVSIENALLTITYVNCSPDLKQAKIGFSILPDNLTGTALKKLATSTGQVVTILKKRLKLRQIPHLIWEFDDTEKEAAKIEKLIDDTLKEEEN